MQYCLCKIISQQTPWKGGGLLRTCSFLGEKTTMWKMIFNTGSNSGFIRLIFSDNLLINASRKKGPIDIL